MWHYHWNKLYLGYSLYLVNLFDLHLSIFNTLLQIQIQILQFSQGLIFFSSYQKLVEVFFFCQVNSSSFEFFSFLSNHLKFISVDQLLSSPLSLAQVFWYLSGFVQYAPLWDIWRSCYSTIEFCSKKYGVLGSHGG